LIVIVVAVADTSASRIDDACSLSVACLFALCLSAEPDIYDFIQQ
jgi:hypothetical protein